MNNVMRTSVGAAFLLALGGCGPGEQAAPADGAAGPEGAELHQRLLAMEEGQRNAVFIRALRDAGEQCQHVAASGYQQEHGGLPMWAARCEDGSEWAFFITRDGTAQVVDCDIAVRAGIPACRIEEAAADPEDAVADPQGAATPDS